jgi:nucleotide-binding universal stress UspA family protein
MKILMGVDDSKYSEDVMQTIVTQFRSEHTEVRVLHVLQPSAPAPPQMAPGYAPELDDQKKPALALVERIAGELRSAGFDSAAEWGADLIVVGSHGRRGVQRFLLGSVAEFVARHAKCSVEIVRTSVSS